MGWRRQGGSCGDAGHFSPETGQTSWVTEAATDRSCAKRETSCHSVTCVQRGSGSKGTSQKGRTLKQPIITPSNLLLSPFWAVCMPGHLSKILGSSPVQHRLPVMWKVTAIQLTLSASTASREKLALKLALQRSEQSCPVQGWLFFIFMSKLRSLSSCLNAEAVAFRGSSNYQDSG